ncbi:MAG TPA: hypothetical protein VGJ73_20415, partial [Verrucomicrobiae bacterium]
MLSLMQLSYSIQHSLYGRIQLWLVILCFAFLDREVSGEIIFQDSFANVHGGNVAGTTVTNSIPFIDVEGDGWQIASANTALYLDGQGHFFDAVTNGGTATVALTPIGPDGRQTVTATVQLPVGNANWIGMGLESGSQLLTQSGSLSGPWVRINNNGSAIFYGGANTNNPDFFSNAFTNNGNPVTVSLVYDAFQGSASLSVISGNDTNVLLDSAPVTNSIGTIYASCLAFQFSAVTAVLSNRWVGPVWMDWIPRPPPLLTLPVPANSIVTFPVGAPTGTDDTALIQSALTLAAKSGQPAQVQFNASATYLITNSSLVTDIPLTLSNATNVVVNGDGCKVIIENPRIGFLHVQSCSNIIIEGITVDYNPLPFTQGPVIRNLYTDPIGTATNCIEFRPETGYPTPTNANYVDANAVNTAERWGTIMNTNYPGRGADDRYTINDYKNVTATTTPGVYQVQIPTLAHLENIQAGDYWCMVSRWNSSSVYSAGNSYQVTFLDLTNYAGAAANFEAQLTPLVSEIACQVGMGPPPPGATVPRMRSSNADGGYFGYSRIGPWVEDCVFTGLGDDVANAYINPFVITSDPTQPTNRFSLGLYNTSGSGGPPSALTSAYLQTGDQLVFFNALTGVIFDQAFITNVNLPYASVDHPVAGIVNGTYETNTLVYDISLNTSAVYLNNQFSNSRIHGIYCRADNMLIAHNSVSGMGLSAISAFPALDLGSPNSFVPTNVIIMDNVLSDCSYTFEAISNLYARPNIEPACSLVELHQTAYNTDYVTNTFGISGIRILNNAFLNWRIVPLTLHNVSDCRVIGNYFGPPITSDNLVPLEDDWIADLWVCDYGSMTFSGNVNATAIANAYTIAADDYFTNVPGAFENLTSPSLSINVQPPNAVINWLSPAPGFILQQANAVSAG